ncbi:hypothetical protein HWV62_40396 [Athelia sp. TMB]|nr:hypothetical protein HWV62_40396 [Athelia sp. TMB]
MSRAARVTAPCRRDMLALLKLTKDIPSDTFPALKRSAASAIFIVEEVAKFESNREDWATFRRFIQDGVTTVIQSLGSNDLLERSDVYQMVDNLATELDKVATSTRALQQVMPAGRIRSVRKDRAAIADMKMRVQAALNHFTPDPTHTLAVMVDTKQVLARIIERYKKCSISEASNVIGTTVQDFSASEDEERVRRASLTFNTIGTSGGTVINVAGNYSTHTVDGNKSVASIREISALDRLPYAGGGSWSPTMVCLPGTRVSTLSAIHEWSLSLDRHNIFLLKGVAGSGKSAISHTVAKALYECGLLISCFFFDRESSSRNTPRLLFTTIARDIASLFPAIAADISASLEKEPALASAHISRQFEALVAGPLRRHPIDRQIVVVVDALDEAIGDDADTDLLTILRDGLSKLSPRFRVFITSRPTRAIDQFLPTIDHITSHYINIDSSENMQDIAAYIDAMLQDNTIRSQMGSPWPDDALSRDLKVAAGGLFIWIATVFAYLRNAYKPRAKLQALLSNSQSHPHGPIEPTRKIDALYATILEDCGNWDDTDFCQDYALFMGSIMAVKRPLSLAALRCLHGGNEELSLDRLPQRFGSVLVGLHDEHEPIHTLHLSFREFVTARAGERTDTRKFFLSEKEHSRQLAELCLRTIVHGLTAAPIIGTGFLSRDKDDKPGIPKLNRVSEQLLYGCESWGHHICDIENPTAAVVEIMQEFLPHHCTTATEIVASTSTFTGSLSVWRWLKVSVLILPTEFMVTCGGQDYGTELAELYDRASKASEFSRLSHRLRYAGRLEEALVAIEESVYLRRTLAAERPRVFNAPLASSLNSLSISLSELGRGEEALTMIQEAAKLYRTLAAEQPGAFNATLAISLYSLSNCLSDLGRREEALVAIQEATSLHRTLAAERPRSFNTDLAKSLNNLSINLSDLGRHEEALNVIQEAVSLCRTLAAERPQAFNADLASSLGNLSNCLSGLGRHEEALAVIQEAASLLRTLATEQPNAFNATLAKSINNLSVRLSDLGRREEALTAMQETTSLYRDLAEERPLAFNADLATSLNRLSNHFSTLGRREEALTVVQEAVSLYRTLAAARPKVFNANLATSLKSLSIRLSGLGRREEALTAIQEAVSLYRTLAEERPLAFNTDLARSLNHLSALLSVLGRREEALTVVQEAVKLYQTLAAERPGAFKADIATSLHNLSNHLSALGRREEALTAIQDAASLRRTLAAERPGTFNPDLARSLYNLSACLSDLERHKEALPAAEEAVGLLRALVAERPAAYASELPSYLRRLAKYLSVNGRKEEARVVWREAEGY